MKYCFVLLKEIKLLLSFRNSIHQQDSLVPAMS